MATTLTVQQSALTGTAITMGAATATGSGGDIIPAGTGEVHWYDDGERQVLRHNDHVAALVTNGSGSSINVTATVPGNAATTVVAVAAGATKLIGPFPKVQSLSGGNEVTLTYSAVTTVTVAAIRV